MKIMKTVAIPASEDIVLDRLRCDVCKAESNSDRRIWANGVYHVATVKIVMSEGYNFRGDGWEDRTSFDLCPDCFREKLIPFIESLGAKPEITNE